MTFGTSSWLPSPRDKTNKQMEHIIVCEMCVVHGFNFMLKYWLCICVADCGKHANPQGWTTLYEPTHGKCENVGQNGTQKMSFLEKCCGTWPTDCKHVVFAYVLKTFQSENSQGWTHCRKHTYPHHDQKSIKNQFQTHNLPKGQTKLNQNLLKVHEHPGYPRWREFQRWI